MAIALPVPTIPFDQVPVAPAAGGVLLKVVLFLKSGTIVWLGSTSPVMLGLSARMAASDQEVMLPCHKGGRINFRT